ncbi:hypothetical protein IBE48_00255 [Francisella philomiragia]|uniref:Lipoprotein n=1 Tax=Francisella philomiragia TaxID=28110 RepID=A0AAW3D980_9GAMM|nr:hypothetical protein [Francisella philomiragia]KFJ42409.1 hypothetical protein DR78_52 [Francisella philomiragia]MBK2254279.1 hypothetical protein [Francisella philomiragia]MBK2272592.1 hypothetical protein [Francisella philomiragia]MBK2276433.1 hypothetical protein [Francisella philomiragia]MBK2280380.1 hypothetical protein [Francisella philomiragia]
MLKKIMGLISLVIILVGCKDAYKNNQWSKFHRDSSTSSDLHSRLVEVHNRESIGFTYSPYGADFRNKLN